MIVHGKVLPLVVVISLGLALLTLGCRERRDTHTSIAVPVDADQEPGSHVEPTSEMSRRLLKSDPAARRAWFRAAISEAGHQCVRVTTAVIKAGGDGTDLWRVGCDGQGWLVTLDPAKTSVEHCASARVPYCEDGLKGLEWQS